MARKLLLASAGAGKSEGIAKEALAFAESGNKVLLLTYTINNQAELVRHICRLNKFQPRNIVVKGWFTFLLEDMIRPYQLCVIPDRVSGVLFDSRKPHLVPGKPFQSPGRAEKIKEVLNPLHFVTHGDNRAYTYYLAKLATRIHEGSGGRPAHRLAEIYQAIFIDEMQDLVGWDFDVIRIVMDSGIPHFHCVGDFRQSIYQTSETNRAPRTNHAKLEALKKMGFEVDHLNISRRCIQSICDLADRVHTYSGQHAPTVSQVADVPEAFADHLGVFAVPTSLIKGYLERYNPVILRWDRRTKEALCEGRVAYNFGQSKGLGFERVLIIPPDAHAKFLCGDTTAFDGARTDESRNKLYVAITRARYSVAFEHAGGSVINGAQIWAP